MKELPEHDYEWLSQDSLVVAPALLGWMLRSKMEGKITAGIITEVEAYHGSDDPASHAFRGRTRRNAPMFYKGGAVYVYFTYGMYNCVNIVTGPENTAQAVLIRSIEPVHGIDVMVGRRHQSKPELLTTGPGRLTQALGISLGLSGSRLGDDLDILPPTSPVGRIITGPRVGISRAVDWPWRYYLADSVFVSGSRIRTQS